MKLLILFFLLGLATTAQADSCRNSFGSKISGALERLVNSDIRSSKQLSYGHQKVIVKDAESKEDTVLIYSSNLEAPYKKLLDRTTLTGDQYFSGGAKKDHYLIDQKGDSFSRGYYIPLRDFRPLAHFYYTFDNEWRLNPEGLVGILENDGALESCYSITGDFQSESFVSSQANVLRQIFNEIKKTTQNRDSLIAEIESQADQVQLFDGVVTKDTKASIIEIYQKLVEKTGSNLDSSISEKVIKISREQLRINSIIKDLSKHIFNQNDRGLLVEKARSFVFSTFCERQAGVPIDCVDVRDPQYNADSEEYEEGIRYELSGSSADFYQNLKDSMATTAKHSSHKMLSENIDLLTNTLSSNEASLKVSPFASAEFVKIVSSRTSRGGGASSGNGQAGNGLSSGSSPGGGKILRTGDRRIFIEFSGKMIEAKKLFGNYFYAYEKAKKKFVVVREKDLLGVVVDETILVNIDAQRIQHDLDAGYSENKLSKAGSVFDKSVKWGGSLATFVSQTLINTSKTIYNFALGVAQEKTESTRLEDLNKAEITKPIIETTKGAFTSLKMREQTIQAQRLKKDLDMQLENKSLLGQLNSSLERTIVDHLLKTNEFLGQISQKYKNVEGGYTLGDKIVDPQELKVSDFIQSNL